MKKFIAWTAVVVNGLVVLGMVGWAVWYAYR